MIPTAATYENPPDRGQGPTILIVDDDLGIRIRLEALCQKLGEDELRILSCSSSVEASELIRSTQVHVVLLDKNLGPHNDSRFNGIKAIPEMLEADPHLQILVVTGSNQLNDVVEAIRLGALGYAIKGDAERDAILIEQIKNAIKIARLVRESACNRRASFCDEDSKYEFVGESKMIKKLFKEIEAFAESNRPLLLTGESGTGKTVTAQLVHEHRKTFLAQEDRPFIKLNLSALSPSLIEAELFGSEEGAYTGSKKTKIGFLELANSGTLFIDEVADIPLAVQIKLLTVLGEGEFYRVGGTKRLHTSFKLICATNRDLVAMVDQGSFNEALYNRISTFQIRLPSLSERKEDIPAIVKAVLPKVCRQNNVFCDFEDLPNEFIDFLAEHTLSSNIRGIEDQISRLLVLSPKDRKGLRQFHNWRQIPGFQSNKSSKFQKPQRESITLKDLLELPIYISGSDFPGLGAITDLITRKIILTTRERFNTNRDLAKFLQVSDATVTYQMKKFEKHSFQPRKSSGFQTESKETSS